MPDYEDRTKEFKEWHRSLSPNYLAIDIDLVEIRIKDSKPVPVATFELTRYDTEYIFKPYLNAVLKRYSEGQGAISKMLAERLNVPCYIVLFNKSVTKFHVYNLTAKKG